MIIFFMTYTLDQGNLIDIKPVWDGGWTCVSELNIGLAVPIGLRQTFMLIEH